MKSYGWFGETSAKMTAASTSCDEIMMIIKTAVESKKCYLFLTDDDNQHARFTFEFAALSLTGRAAMCSFGMVNSALKTSSLIHCWIIIKDDLPRKRFKRLLRQWRASQQSPSHDLVVIANDPHHVMIALDSICSGKAHETNPISHN